MQILVENTTYQMIAINVSPDMSVLALKELLIKEKISVKKRLRFQNQVLENARTLKEYGIKADDEIFSEGSQRLWLPKKPPEEGFSFTIIGKRQSGKNKLVSRIINTGYIEEYQSPIALSETTIQLNQQNIPCLIQNTSRDAPGDPDFETLFLYQNAIIWTIDLSQSIDEAIDFLQGIKKYLVLDKPIFIVGTKNDLSNQNKHLTKEQLEHLIQLYNKETGLRFFGPFMTSAKTGDGVENLLTAMVKHMTCALSIENQKQHAVPTSEKQKLIKKLEDYTSTYNQFIAGLKFCASFGFFSLGLQKQCLAKNLKMCLTEERDSSNTIKIYQRLHDDAVKNEFKSTCSFFKNQYGKWEDNEVKIQTGTLGKILSSF